MKIKQSTKNPIYFEGRFESLQDLVTFVSALHAADEMLSEELGDAGLAHQYEDALFDYWSISKVLRPFQEFLNTLEGREPDAEFDPRNYQ